VVFYSTLSPQKCTKLNTEKQHAQGHLGSNLTPEGENRNFRKTVITNSTKRLSPTAQNGYHQQHKTVITNSTKRLSPTAQNHYADLEDTCRDKVTHVGVIVRYTKKVIGKKTKAGVIFDPGWPFEG